MKTTLGFLTEEGRTRRKNAARRICVYATLMFLIAGASGYGIHRYWVSPSLTPLQRVYFKQYLKSTYRSYLPNSRSRYTTLTRTIADPQTKKDVALAVVDDEADPVLDDQRRIKFDPVHRPIFRIKDGVPFKRFYWNDVIGLDVKAYDWFRKTIYSGPKHSRYLASGVAGRNPHLPVWNNFSNRPRHVRATAIPERRASQRHARAFAQGLRSRTPPTPWLLIHCLRKHIRRKTSC